MLETHQSTLGRLRGLRVPRAITPSPFEESRAAKLGNRAVLWFILLQLPIGALSSYRAWVQIKELTLTTVVVEIEPQMLAEFDPGPAVLRASAVGRPQWLRVPPPTIREMAVTISR